MRVLAQTKDMPREEWLELRKKSIGGSDASVVLGLNKWRSQYTMWADKRGLLEPVADNEAMRVGRDLEQYVADRFCEATGKKVRRRNAMFLHDSYDFMSANIDREVVGENAALECKTINVFARADFESNEIPLYYYCQCVHYMAVMGYDKMYLAVLVLGKAFHWFEIERNEDEITSLIEAEKKWWERYMLNDEIPEIDGSDSTSATLNEIYPNSRAESIALYGDEAIVESYMQAKAKEKEYKELATKYQNQLVGLMGENDTAELKGYTITYKSQSRTSIDGKRLKADLPDIYEQYSKTTSSRAMRIKEVKED
jgi:putative phage-type endonuclease